MTLVLSFFFYHSIIGTLKKLTKILKMESQLKYNLECSASRTGFYRNEWQDEVVACKQEHSSICFKRYSLNKAKNKKGMIATACIKQACDDCKVLLLHWQPATALALTHGPKKKEYVATDRIITYQHFQHNLKSAKEQNWYAMLQVTPQNKAL